MDSLHSIDLSVFIARTLGVIYLSVGLGFFLFREMYVMALRKILNSPANGFLGGFMAVIGGMAMVTYHNIWISDWRVIITVVGWIALIKGILILLMPNYMGMFRSLLLIRNGKVMTVIILLVGILLTYLGFFH